jgi:hypothetical protein
MDIDPTSDPHYILTRAKSCPCCRAVVRRRPVPVFLVKAVVGAVAKARAGNSNIRSPGGSRGSGVSSLDEEDPWKGIFMSDEDEEEYGSSLDYDDDDDDDDDDDEDDDEDDDDDEGEDSDDSDEDRVLWAFGDVGVGGMPGPFRLESEESSSGSDSQEEEDEDGGEDNNAEGEGDPEHTDEDAAAPYVPPRWEPPTIAADADDVDYDSEEFPNVDDAESLLKMLRRGCSQAMIQNFEMSYSHRSGLIAHVPSLDERHVPVNITMPRDSVREAAYNRVFLGWNIRVDETDGDGHEFMRVVLREVKRRSTGKWRVDSRAGYPGAFDVKRLVKAEDVEEWDTTDTEAWVEGEGAGDVE